jgi:Chaperone of endosialidase
MGGGGAPRMATPARGGGGRAGGGRRSDVTLKHDITLLGRLDNGLGFYRFSYNGSDQVYVGVIAQEVKTIMPEAVVRSRDGYLEVFYDKLGLKFQTYDQWVASGARVPTITRIRH